MSRMDPIMRRAMGCRVRLTLLLEGWRAEARKGDVAAVTTVGACNVAGAVNADACAIMRAREALREMRAIVDLLSFTARAFSVRFCVLGVS